ncbi:ATP-binding protein [Halobellus sp. EA9]|uniref:PAS domain-containing sensor histidine kinase n=1 Tax=Halobellus sp. EA9 TaxID=3421647 RepID=UPI003EBBEDAD
MNDPAGSDAAAALSQVASDLGDAVLLYDAESGALRHATGGVDDVFGYSRERFCDLDPAAYADDPEREAASRAAAARDAADAGSGTYRWRARRADGTTFTAESTVSRTAVDGRACLACVVRDVTARAEREHRLERLAETLVHDLRNPLNAAEAQAGILRTEVEGGREFLDRLDRVHARMRDIVSDVHALVSDGRRVDDPESVDLDAVVADAWAAVSDCQDDRAGADCDDVGRCEFSIEGSLGTVVGDARRLGRLFENLFENALRHAGDGGVSVRVAPLDRGGVAVVDDGPGIPAGDRGRIFEHGYTTADDGTGFGLNIVAAAVEAHGWEITVCESESGGARFEITGMDAVGAERADGRR